MILHSWILVLALVSIFGGIIMALVNGIASELEEGSLNRYIHHSTMVWIGVIFILFGVSIMAVVFSSVESLTFRLW